MELKQGNDEAAYRREWLYLHAEEPPTVAHPFGVPVIPDDRGIHNRGVITYPKSPGRHPAILILTQVILPSENAADDDRAAYGLQTRLTENGNVILIVAPRPSPPGTEEIKAPILGPFYLTELRAELVGKTILGMRVDDIIRAVDYLASRTDVDPNRISAQASGHLALALLHAAILDPRLKHITVTGALPSYDSLLKSPMPVDAPHDILPGVLLHYDIPDLLHLLDSRVTVTNQQPATSNQQPETRNQKPETRN